MDVGKAFDKVQHASMIKVLKKVEIDRTYINIMRAVYNKPIVNVIVNGGILKAFSPKSRMRQGCSLLLFLFNVGLKVFPIVIR